LITQKKIHFIMPFLIIIALLALLAYELFYKNINELPSTLIGETLPEFQLPAVIRSQNNLSSKQFVGQVSLLNVWATWCYACTEEHAMLMKISKDYHVPIYGIDYKDKHDDALLWLNNKGNPYQLIGDDKKGDVAIDLGVYGTPETFIINRQGKIVYRHIGAITQDHWDQILYPLIKKYEQAQ